MPDTWSGGCQCGAVRYRITGPLGHSGICHCRMCQKAGGNFGMVLLTTPMKKVEWTRGKPAEFASTPVTVRGFCANCGTPLYMHEAGDTNYELTVGSLDNPDIAPPVDEVGTESKRAWFNTITTLPGHTTAEDRTPEDMARLVNQQHPDHDTEDWKLEDQEFGVRNTVTVKHMLAPSQIQHSLSTLVGYWTELEGTVHPQDAPVFDQFRDHGFNLDFPPPAYIGDILNAPIIILDNNGGFDPDETPKEFPDAHSHNEFRETLAAPAPLDPSKRCTSPYYCSRNYTELLTSGTAALVNGVAYRSVSGLSNRVAELTRILPSALFHQAWLRNVVFPMAESGERFVVIHRWSRWNSATDVFREHPAAVFSSAPVSRDLTGREMAAARKFLQKTHEAEN